jgi:hypothetical protein
MNLENMNNEFNLPRNYLSYSAWQLWQSDKTRFRNKYYLGIDTFETAETIYGKQIAKRLEDGEKIEGVEEYEKAEKSIKVELIPGLMLLGYLDGFTEENLKIVELKSGHADRKGKAPWDNLKVRRHKQLPFYCLLVQLKYGTYNPDVTLQWLETEFKSKEMEFDGHILTTQSRELELTGRVETFERHIEQWELDKMKEDIIRISLEISEDYTLWQKTN